MHRLSAEQVLEKLRAGNRRFVENRSRDRDHLKDIEITSRAQYPIAAVVGCMDSRAPSTIIFDQGIGDIFAISLAGNVINDDVIGSLEYACKVVGSKVIVILGHTECGAVKGAIDCVCLGKLTGLLDQIKPVIAHVPECIQPRTSDNPEFVDAVARANVRHMIEEVRLRSPILTELEQTGLLAIEGGIYDVRSGLITFFRDLQDSEPQG